MTAEGRPAVIDWSSATLADPRVDVANTFAISFINNGDLPGARGFRAGYEAMSGRTLPNMDYFELLCVSRRLIAFLVTMVKGAAMLGVKPGIEPMLRRQAPAWGLSCASWKRRAASPCRRSTLCWWAESAIHLPGSAGSTRICTFFLGHPEKG